MDQLLWLEGIGDHEGYFDIAFLPFIPLNTSSISEPSGIVRRQSGCPEPRATPPKNPSPTRLYFGVKNIKETNRPTSMQLKTI